MRELEHVLGLRAGEAERREVSRTQLLDALARRELPRDVVPDAVALDEIPPDRGGRLQRDLLRRDRDDEGLERPRVHGRAESGNEVEDRGERLVPRGPGAERVEVERKPEQETHLRRGVWAPGLDLDTAVRRRDPNLATSDDPVQPALVPHRRAVRPEVSEARRRELEVVGLGDPQDQAADVNDGRAARASGAALSARGRRG